MTFRTVSIPKRRVPERLIRAREEKAGGDAYPCVCCGLPVPAPTTFVRVVEGGGVALHPDDVDAFEADADAMRGDVGLYPIGPECARRETSLRPFLIRT